jgi:hypothetical protein
MALRPTMAALIARVRQLIFDTAQQQVFADQQVQDALDLHRQDVRYAALRPMPTFQQGPNTLYLDYYSDAGAWEDDYVIQDLSYLDITGNLVTREPLSGHWAFSAQPNGIGVRITGKCYDVYAAAADLLDQWAIQLKLNMTFSSDNQRFEQAKVAENMMAMAARYRTLAQPGRMRIVQGDAQPDQDGGGIVYPNVGGGSEYI